MNRMEQLLNKIERRLGTKMLNLPEAVSKTVWADEVIDQDTLPTFSRYFPNDLIYVLSQDTPMKNGWYLIDEEKINSAEIIGVGDIDFGLLSRDQQYSGYQYGLLDNITSNYGVEDIMMFQNWADLSSAFQNNIFLEFKAPNMVKVTDSVRTNLTKGMKNIPIHLFTKHPKNLMTISQTMMEIFEDLAIADVASFLYEQLKYFDGLENVYANIDLKMQDLSQKADKRSEIVQKLEDAHVSFANQYQPMIYTV